MASEEERAAILAEYKASVASANNHDDEDEFDDDEDEADFNPDAAFSDDEEEEGDYDEDDEAEEKAEPDYVVLNGSIHLNEEGRIIYSGTWCMKSELDTDTTTTNNNGGATTDPKQHKKKHHPKFKLKSQNVCYPPPPPPQGGAGGGTSNNKKLFDIRQPTLTDSGEVPSRRIMVFDGFFVAKPSSTPPGDNAEDSTPVAAEINSAPKKIKERDVELFISLVENETNGDNLKDEKSTYRIAGRGQNEYGQFVLDGTYTPPTVFDKHNKATVICNKTYGVGGATKETRAASKGSKRKARSDDDSFDEDFDSEERADYTELIELSEDANLSVEELRKKYYGGGGDDNEEEVDEDDDGGGKMSAAVKKPRLEEESDDEECGF